MKSWCLAIGYPESGFVIKQCAVLIQQKIHPFHSYQAEGPFYSHMILMWNQSYKGFEADLTQEYQPDQSIINFKQL